MCRKGDISVGRICYGQVGNKVIKSAVVRDADEGDALKELPRGLGIVIRGTCDENKAVCSLNKPLAAFPPNSVGHQR